MTLLRNLMAAADVPNFSALRRRAEVHENVWSEWMTLKRDPTVKPLTRVAAVLHCTPGTALDAILEERARRKSSGAVAVPIT